MSLLDNAIEDALTRDSKNIERFLRRQSLEETAKFVVKNMNASKAVSDKWTLLDIGIDAALPVLHLHPTSNFCEFGVASGATINHIAKRIPHHTVYGFDSFEGLPEHWRDGFPKGAFKRDALPAVAKNAVLIKGYFDDTLYDFLQKNPGPAAFLHVDCDLYSSTRTIFEVFRDRLVDGSVIVFDEYFNYPGWKDGEHKAFCEFIETSQFSVEYLGYCKYHQQIAVRLVTHK
ncbi:class I SAM-dependent methyltransferase [Desulfovibrio inopinatus]|uniref:class I SAM-dependent methyltransferase n=1 Tax=Desulfovibrio inopinatus TaxID=102109 RepID=UPI0004275831|nr:class I SAM-dependent methyltransferase [Desulfovibrio inopinatus]